jgi:hypothetical protein
MVSDTKTIDMSVRGEPVAAERQALELTTLMSVPARSEILVTCRGGMKLELSLGQHIILSAETPTTFFLPSVMRLEPLGQLGPDFVLGWRKLLEELRIQILAHNLVSPNPIRHTRDGSFTLSPTLYNYLAIGPEIARLAHETFYRENSFQFQRLLTSTNRCIKLHPAGIRLLIKRLTLVVELCESD